MVFEEVLLSNSLQFYLTISEIPTILQVWSFWPFHGVGLDENHHWNKWYFASERFAKGFDNGISRSNETYLTIKIFARLNRDFTIGIIIDLLEIV